jgi:hypothetical protein
MAGAAAAQAHKEFDLSIGYAHVELDGSASPFDSRDGLRLEPRFSWGVGDDTDGSQLRLGFGLGISGFERRNDRDGRVIIIDEDDGETFTLNADEVETLTLITPEFQISWRQMLGDADARGERRWFVEPGVGVGVVIGQYWVGDTFGFWSDTDVEEWDATIAGRPFLRAGYQGERWVFAIEGSYQFGGDLHFTDDIEGNLSEWYVGAFFGGRW